MSYLNCDMGIDEKLDVNFSVFPVPTSAKLYAQVNGLEIVGYNIVDIQGRQIASESNIKLPVLEYNTSGLKAGVYYLHVETIHGSVKREFVIE
jgi:hypothetical protein